MQNIFPYNIRKPWIYWSESTEGPQKLLSNWRALSYEYRLRALDGRDGKEDGVRLISVVPSKTRTGNGKN